MSSQYDVVVVGAGIVGSSTAYHVAKRGMRVLLVEQYDFLHKLGSSHGQSRIIRRTYPSKAYTAMMTDAYEAWEQVEQDCGRPLVHRKGGLDLFPEDSDAAVHVQAACRELEIPIEILSPEDVKDRFGINIPEHYRGAYQAETGILNADRCCSAIQAAAFRLGAEWRERATLVGVDRGASQQDSLGVKLSDGEKEECLRASHLILCLGPWAKDTLQSLFGLSLPLRVMKCYFHYFQKNQREGTSGNDAALERLPVIIDYGSAVMGEESRAMGAEWGGDVTDGLPHPVYFLPSHEIPGLVKAGSHSGKYIDLSERTFTIDHSIAERIVGPWMEARMPFMDPEPVTSSSCLYTMTPSEDFIIDLLPGDDRISLAAGFSGHGFKFGPLVGRSLVQLALEKSFPDERWERFRIHCHSDNTA